MHLSRNVHTPGTPLGEFAAAHTASPPSVHVLALSISGRGTVGATHVGGDVSALAGEPQGRVVDEGLPTVVYPGRHEYVYEAVAASLFA